ncbi:MAG: adenylate/guanylate cyclase domain-containing protein [Bacteroidota bacterium]
MLKKKILGALFIILFWMFGVLFLTLFSMLTIRGYLEVAGVDPKGVGEQWTNYWLSPSQFIEAILFGIFFGILFVAVNELSDRFQWDRWSFSKVIVAKSILYTVGFVATFLIIYSIIEYLGFFPPEILDYVAMIAWGPLVALIFVYMLFNISLLNYIIQTHRKVGDFSLVSFLTGKYREPVVENRIFMFIDLRSSTMLAETLGSVKYSRLLRDCFQDLNTIVSRYPVEIYQYVGDEAVLTAAWKADSVNNMVELFFDYRLQLLRRQSHYETRYAHAPYFKAAVHGGEVTTTEVGTLRRHIAFHGDVVNTTSRMQHLCNELGEVLLMSEEVFATLQPSTPHAPEFKGRFELTGKKEPTAIVSIRQVPA